MPSEFWYLLLGALLGAAATLYGAVAWVSGDAVPRSVPSIAKKDAQRPPSQQAAPWENLSLYDVPPDTAVVRDTVRIPKETSREPKNGLPEATYDPEVLQEPELTRPVPYGIVPLRSGQRPDLSVGPREVTLRLVNPNTAGFMEYTYRVPSPTWRLTTSIALSYSKDRSLGASLDPSASIGLSRQIGKYRVGIRGGVGTGDPSWSAGITIKRTLWTSFN